MIIIPLHNTLVGWVIFSNRAAHNLDTTAHYQSFRTEAAAAERGPGRPVDRRLLVGARASEGSTSRRIGFVLTRHKASSVDGGEGWEGGSYSRCKKLAPLTAVARASKTSGKKQDVGGGQPAMAWNRLSAAWRGGRARERTHE